MRSRYVASALSVLFSAFFLVGASGLRYPNPVGYVNDFANIIPAGVKARLKEELLVYENRTSIKRQEDAVAWASLKNNLLYAGLAAGIIAILALVGWLTYLPIKKRKERERAERECKGLLKEIPIKLKAADEAVLHKDVKKETRKMLTDAKAKFDEGRDSAADLSADWIAALAILLTASAVVKNVLIHATYDKNAAEAAKRPKPNPVPVSAGSSPKRNDDDNSYSSGSSWSSSGSSSGSSSDSGFGGFSGGGFGGFGGGSFGGGGASGSW